MKIARRLQAIRPDKSLGCRSTLQVPTAALSRPVATMQPWAVGFPALADLSSVRAGLRFEINSMIDDFLAWGPPVLLAAVGGLTPESALKAGGVMLAWGSVLGLIALATRNTRFGRQGFTKGMYRGAVVSAVIGAGLLLDALASTAGVDPETSTLLLMIAIPVALIGLSRYLNINLAPGRQKRRP